MPGKFPLQFKRKSLNYLDNHNPEPNRKSLYSDLPNRPDQKSNDLNPDDSANPDITIKSLFFLLFA